MTESYFDEEQISWDLRSRLTEAVARDVKEHVRGSRVSRGRTKADTSDCCITLSNGSNPNRIQIKLFWSSSVQDTGIFFVTDITI